MSWTLGDPDRRKFPSHGYDDLLAKMTQIEVRCTSIEHHQQATSGILQKIDRAMHGNGNEGLVLRHDRVEQTVKTWSWAIGAAWVTLLGIIGRLLIK